MHGMGLPIMCLFEKQISILFMTYGHSVQICAFALRFFVYKSKKRIDNCRNFVYSFLKS